MKATWSWIKDFVPALEASPEEVGRRLTAAGLEVESVLDLAKGLEKVVVGKLLEVNKHPNADKLTLCKVALSADGGDARSIVCGATNHKAGDKVAVALPGAMLPDPRVPGGKKIEKSKVRGEVSEGMLCSTVELGLGPEADGIWILPADTKEGTPLAQAMGLMDAVFEIGVTPNRGDCLSIVGVAREVAAALGTPLKRPLVESPAGADAAKKIQVAVEEREGCPHYVARMIENVTIAPSPAWMARRLEQCGVRPINNVVDVTNYVMVELGQPLHAFDARDLRGGTIVVRRAKPGETMKTLDGIERKLVDAGDDYDLVIADAERPVAIAGVMGGENSGVRADTKTVVLESAWFEPARVRRTARRHGLHTESSHRFERAVDPSGVDKASARAASLIAELGKGTIVPGKVEVASRTVAPRQIRLTVSRTKSLLGLDVSRERIEGLLAPLQISLEGAGTGDSLTATAPPFRDDLREEVDLIEEIARRIGYDEIPATRPASYLTAENVSVDLLKTRRAREILVGMGFSETVHLPFGANDESAKMRLPADDSRSAAVWLANPIAEDQAVLRGSLLPVLLANLSRNRAKKNADVRTFELRATFRWKGEGKLPEETRRLTGLLSGRRSAPNWDVEDEEVDFFDAKGAVEAFVGTFCGRQALISAATEPFLVAGAQARLELNGRALGVLGEVHPEVLAAFDAGARAFVFDLDYDALAAVSGGTPHYAEIPRFPSAERDVALVVDESTEVGAMLSFARGQAKKSLESVTVFDLFRGGKLPAGKKSVALAMTWRAPDRTLTDEEVNGMQEKVVQALQDRFKGERRT